MRRTAPFAGLLVAVALALSACAPSLPAQKTQVDAMLGQTARTFAWNASNSDFRARYSWLDFSTDGCSNWFLPDHLNDTGLTFDFTAACWHHDFGYRNYKRFKAAGMLPNPEASRERIDQMFKNDMAADCAVRPAWQRPTCNTRSDLYHYLARTYGQL